MTNPTFTEKFFPDYVYNKHVYDILDDELSWENREAPRDECFLALDTNLTYSYGRGQNVRAYQAKHMHHFIHTMMLVLNNRTNANYNVCMMNRYKDQRNHLGWHADDSPEQDPEHPIAVISFGASRYIYVRENGFKGVIPEENKFLLTPGSLFVMPGGFQETHQHKIPKHDSVCGGRISLTFRKLDR